MPIKKDIVLIHGWDPRYYNGNNLAGGKDMAWASREEFIKKLKNKYNLEYYNLPGFCNNKEPNKKYFDVEDFADSFAKWKNGVNFKPKLLVGYSFGGAVLLNYKVRYKDPTPIVLISPAIFRGESGKSVLARMIKPMIPSALEKYLKHWYQYLMSKYYRKGSSFLRSSYDVIVRRDLRPQLKKIDSDQVLLIYGDGDGDTPWNLVEKTVKKWGIKHVIVAGGGHGIAQTHPKEIVDAINNFVNKFV